jgi:hypothetical protein
MEPLEGLKTVADLSAQAQKVHLLIRSREVSVRPGLQALMLGKYEIVRVVAETSDLTAASTEFIFYLTQGFMIHYKELEAANKVLQAKEYANDVQFKRRYSIYPEGYGYHPKP